MSWSAPSRPPWLSNDDKIRLSKNGDFFKKLHQMKEALIETEESNLRNAIARIENKKYGRRFIASRDKYNDGDNEGINGYRKFEAEVTASRLDKKARDPIAVVKGQKDAAKALSATVDEKRSSGENFDFGSKKRRQVTQHRYSDVSSFSTKDKQIAKIAANLHSYNTTDSYNFIRNPDHLPSIPSVGHRVSFTHKNRFKAMTWESEFSQLPRMNIINTKKVHETSSFQRHPSADHNKTTKEIAEKKKRDHELRFNVNPRDKEIFRHLTKDAGTPSPKLPTPPVNSRLANHTVPAIPKIFLPEEEKEDDTQEDSQDSARSLGELNNAMRRFVTAHSNLEHLKEELGTIVHTNDNLHEATEDRNKEP